MRGSPAPRTCTSQPGGLAACAFAAATTTGRPKRNTRRKAIDATANHPQPNANPASTSVSQCTPSRTLVVATPTAIAAATPAYAAFRRIGEDQGTDYGYVAHGAIRDAHERRDHPQRVRRRTSRVAQ